MGMIRWVAILALFCAPVGAAVYKWTDENGRVQYGDRPGGKDAQPMEMSASPPPSPRTGAEVSNPIELQLERMRRMQAEDDLSRLRERNERTNEPTRGSAANNAEACREAKVQVDYYKDERRRGCEAKMCEHYDKMRRLYEKQEKLFCN